MNDEAQRPMMCIVRVVDRAIAEARLSFEGMPLAMVAFYDTASAALRAARQCIHGVWFVSLNLPDLAGTELIEMLAAASGEKMIVAVGSKYSAQEETAALSSGACQYFVKPLAQQRCQAVIEAFGCVGSRGKDRNEATHSHVLAWNRS